MKTYISVGIGDLFFIDSIMTKEEKESISEIYWACRFGYVMKDLMENNPSYPNLKKQHFIDDEVGKTAMRSLNPVCVPFWHFRPDFHPNFERGLELFGIEDEWDNNNLQTIDVVSMFQDSERPFQESSFLKHSNRIDQEYILFHYPTSTRPRSDITSITSDDEEFLNKLSEKTGLPIKVVSDHSVDLNLNNYELLINPKITEVRDLAANCSYYFQGPLRCFWWRNWR